MNDDIEKSGKEFLELNAEFQTLTNREKTLKDSQTRIDGVVTKIDEKIKTKYKDPSDIKKDPKGYEELRKQYDTAVNMSSTNRRAIVQVAKKREEVKKKIDSRSKFGKETSIPQRPNITGGMGKVNSSQPTLNDTLRPNSKSQRDWNSSNSQTVANDDNAVSWKKATEQVDKAEGITTQTKKKSENEKGKDSTKKSLDDKWKEMVFKVKDMEEKSKTNSQTKSKDSKSKSTNRKNNDGNGSNGDGRDSR